MLGAISAIVVLAFVAESKTNEWAYGQWNYMTYIVKAYMVQERCPRLEINPDILKAVAEKYRINLFPGTRDVSIMMQMMTNQKSWLASQPSSAICVLGVNAFGSSGALVRDLLREK